MTRLDGPTGLEFRREAVPKQYGPDEEIPPYTVMVPGPGSWYWNGHPISEDEAIYIQRMWAEDRLRCPKCREHELRLVVRRYRPEGEEWKTVVGLVEACPCGFQRPNERRLSCAMHDRAIDMMGPERWIPWAMEKQKTHTQVLCGECRRWRIWVPREDT